MTCPHAKLNASGKDHATAEAPAEERTAPQTQSVSTGSAPEAPKTTTQQLASSSKIGCIARSWEGCRKNAILKDPLAPLLVGDQLEAIMGRYIALMALPEEDLQGGNDGAKHKADFFCARSRWLDDRLVEALAEIRDNHKQEAVRVQVVELGPGFQVRPWRLELPQGLVHVIHYDIDFARVLAEKATKLREIGAEVPEEALQKMQAAAAAEGEGPIPLPDDSNASASAPAQPSNAAATATTTTYSTAPPASLTFPLMRSSPLDSANGSGTGGITDWVPVAADLRDHDGTEAALLAAGFDPCAATVFVVEGMNIYLIETQLRELMALMRRMAAPAAAAGRSYLVMSFTSRTFMEVICATSRASGGDPSVMCGGLEGHPKDFLESCCMHVIHAEDEQEAAGRYGCESVYFNKAYAFVEQHGPLREWLTLSRFS